MELNKFKVTIKNQDFGFIDVLCKFLEDPKIRERVKNIIETYNEIDSLWIRKQMIEIFGEDET